MIDSLSKIFNKENITFAIAIFGSLGTLWNIIQCRKKLCFKLHYFGYSKEKRIALAYIQFINRSRLPISITDICLKINGISYPCRKIPTIADTVCREFHGLKSLDNFYSVQFPIALGSLGGTSGYLIFDIPQEYDAPLPMPVKLSVFSNRGRTLEVELQLAQ